MRQFGIGVREVWEPLRSIRPVPYLLAFATFYANLTIRSCRWSLLLKISEEPGSQRSAPPPAVCLQYLVAGRFVDAVAFAGVGNFYRSYLVSRRGGGTFTRVVGTTAAESILDVLLVFCALPGIGMLVSKQPGTPAMETVIAAGPVGAVFMVAALLFMRQYGTGLARRLPDALRRAYGQFHHGVLGALALRGVPTLVILTALVWTLAVSRWYFVGLALGTPISYPMALFASLANAFLAAVPLTPGGLGVIEPGISALFALQLPVSQAIAITVAERFISYGSVIVTGGVLFLGQEIKRALLPKPAD